MAKDLFSVKEAVEFANNNDGQLQEDVVESENKEESAVKWARQVLEYGGISNFNTIPYFNILDDYNWLSNISHMVNMMKGVVSGDTSIDTFKQNLCMARNGIVNAYYNVYGYINRVDPDMKSLDSTILDGLQNVLKLFYGDINTTKLDSDSISKEVNSRVYQSAVESWVNNKIDEAIIYRGERITNLINLHEAYSTKLKKELIRNDKYDATIFLIKASSIVNYYLSLTDKEILAFYYIMMNGNITATEEELARVLLGVIGQLRNSLTIRDTFYDEIIRVVYGSLINSKGEGMTFYRYINKDGSVDESMRFDGISEISYFISTFLKLVETIDPAQTSALKKWAMVSLSNLKLTTKSISAECELMSTNIKANVPFASII